MLKLIKLMMLMKLKNLCSILGVTSFLLHPPLLTVFTPPPASPQLLLSDSSLLGSGLGLQLRAATSRWNFLTNP